MENKLSFFYDTKKFANIIGAVVSVLLVFLEVLIGVQYIRLKPEVYLIVTFIVSCVILDVLCAVQIFFVKTLKTRIILCCVDFVFLLFICTITGNTYLSAMYCVILSQLYFSIDKFKTNFFFFISSCVAFFITSFVGWSITHFFNYEDVIDMVSGGLLGLIILVVHFLVACFFIHYYRMNLRLSKALKEAEDNRVELQEAYEQLSETAVFEERNRIARDIHDNAGHSMTSVIMQTEAAKLLIDEHPEEAKAKIISANIQAKNALEQMRESVHLLAGRNASATIKQLLEGVIAQTVDGADLKIRSDISDIRVEPHIARLLTNSLKECLANGIRHGNATAFYVGLWGDSDAVTLTVSDNGSGFKEDFKEGFGLRGIKEKTAKYGGSIVYESEPGEGVEITIKLPAAN